MVCVDSDQREPYCWTESTDKRSGMKQPCYSLERVKELVEIGQVFLSRRRALDMFPTPREAIAFARRVSKLLSIEHFSETVDLAADKADVYGLCIEGTGWYVKIYIDVYDPDRPETTFISLHPLERSIMTNAGKVEP